MGLRSHANFTHYPGGIQLHARVPGPSGIIWGTMFRFGAFFHHTSLCCEACVDGSRNHQQNHATQAVKPTKFRAPATQKAKVLRRCLRTPSSCPSWRRRRSGFRWHWQAFTWSDEGSGMGTQFYSFEFQGCQCPTPATPEHRGWLGGPTV